MLAEDWEEPDLETYHCKYCKAKGFAHPNSGVFTRPDLYMVCGACSSAEVNGFEVKNCKIHGDFKVYQTKSKGIVGECPDCYEQRTIQWKKEQRIKVLMPSIIFRSIIWGLAGGVGGCVMTNASSGGFIGGAIISFLLAIVMLRSV